MSDQNAGFGDARKLEDIRFIECICEAADKRRADINAMEQNMAARGYSSSGARFKAEIDLVFASVDEVSDRVIAYRKELGVRVPALLTPGNLHILEEKLNQQVDGAIKGIQTRSSLRPRDIAGGVVPSEAERKAWAAKARIKQKLAALALEARLGMIETGEPRVTTVNISHSTISNLNLGTVVGDLYSSIEQLNMEGRIELADAFRQLTEAIGGSTDLDDDARKELLEHLSVVSEESAKPAEQRKMGPLKSSLTSIKSGIAVAAQLFGIYQGLEHALRAAGVIH